MTEEQIKHMRDRFLGWNLPENFNPDCGIHFDADAGKKLNPRNQRYEPSGTNLFDGQQAEAMVRYLVEDMPGSDELRWPTQPEGIGLILTDALNIPEIAAKIAKAIQSGNY